MSTHTGKEQVPATRGRRGTALVVVTLALTMLMLAVTAIAIAGTRDADTTIARLEGSRASQAVEAVTNMAIKEMVDGVDRDGDGAIGTISNDSNTATDPLINQTRVWATSSASAGTTTITARAQNGTASRAVQVDMVGTAPVATTVGTVLLVVTNASLLDAQEIAKRDLIQSWGYTVTTISESATQAQFDAAWRAASVVYISETVISGNVGTKLTDAAVGVISEESALSDELGISTTMTPISTNQISISSATHYITSTLGTGTRTMFTSSQPLRYLSGTLGGFTTLGVQVGTSFPTLAVMDREATLTPSGTAAGRRVYLPFGNTGMDVNQLTADGQTILRRSIEWCMQPVAQWALDETSGTTAVDSIAGRNGTLVNGPTWTSGRIGGGLQLDGWDDYVTIPNATAFQVTRSVTIAGWVRHTAAFPIGTVVSAILRKGDANPNNWQLSIANGRIEFLLDSSDEFGIAGNTTLVPGTWYHVAATWDGATARVYLNGVLDMTPVARAGPISTDTRPVYLGGRIGTTDVTNGIVDDVRFYDRALTAAEVAALASARPRITRWTAISP